ncbi:unnamed protein product [Notodromas monacha]|uniref:Uncharacterized protein n=1 Tax=Notodromas monacha TaxID=399045 RepID=A0A7R9GEN4_9CRUS|nr:unnamed protein product [Notodromas monacha]CAG0918457.1 unnamed protein product [Notodromas monacha]
MCMCIRQSTKGGKRNSRTQSPPIKRITRKQCPESGHEGPGKFPASVSSTGISPGGFNRDLPGYDRYKIIGNESAGEYKLQLKDVNLSDNVEFECQVLPAGNNPPLRAKTSVNVLRLDDDASGNSSASLPRGVIDADSRGNGNFATIMSKASEKIEKGREEVVSEPEAQSGTGECFVTPAKSRPEFVPQKFRITCIRAGPVDRVE